MTILEIFAHPLLQVIAYLLIVVVVVWAVYAIIPKVPEGITKTIAWIIGIIVIAAVVISWITFTFGIGISNM